MKDTAQDLIREKLIVDSGSKELAELLAPFVQELVFLSVASPTSQDTARLITEIHCKIDLKLDRHSFTPNGRLFGLILLSQIRIVRSEIWISSLFIIILGLLVTFFEYPSLPTLPFVIFAPIFAAIGISFIYGAENDPALEIELSTPVTKQVLLSARLTLIFGFDLILGLLASFLIVEVHSSLSYWTLVSLWLGPMTFLSAIAFLSTVLSNNNGLGILISLSLWATFNIARLIPFSQSISSLSYDLLISQINPLLLVASFVMITIGLLFAGNGERELSGN